MWVKSRCPTWNPGNNMDARTKTLRSTGGLVLSHTNLRIMHGSIHGSGQMLLFAPLSVTAPHGVAPNPLTKRSITVLCHTLETGSPWFVSGNPSICGASLLFFREGKSRGSLSRPCWNRHEPRNGCACPFLRAAVVKPK